MRRRGVSLGMVLSIAAVSVLLMLAVGTVGVFNLHFSTGLDQREHARNLAESAVHRAIAELADHPDYGLQRLDTETLPVPGQGYPGRASGYLSFSDARAGDRGVLRSTNNLEGGSQVPGHSGQPVPPQFANLVGLGVCGDAKVQLECLYYRPAFPLGVCGSGQLTLKGVTVLGLAPGVAFPADFSTLAEADQRPASVYSNSTVDRAVNLATGCNVSGSVAALGGVNVSAGAIVKGELRPHASPQKIPALDAEGMVERVRTSVGVLDLPTPLVPIQDYCYHAGDLDLPGDLTLDGGVVAVRGNLTLAGQLRGRGTVIVTGDVTMNSGGLESERNCAVVAGHDLELHGTDPASFFFQGLVYAGHSVAADGVTVVGSLVANGPSGGDVRLDNVRVVTTPGAVQSRVGLPHTGNVGGEDSFYLSLASAPDPAHPGQHVYYGHAIYRMSTLTATGMPGTYKAGVDIRWNPGVARWRRLSGISPGDIIFTDHDEPYDGNRDTILHDLSLLMESDETNRDYWPDIRTWVVNYLDELSGVHEPTQSLDFNLNKILSAAESGRIVLMREIP